jgi:16S rRNA (cytidine1402-2'-O)-methyltransferase
MSQVWWPIMAAGCVIGVDLGGTKLLAGTVDSKLEVHHRAYRLARTDDSGALLDQLVEAIQEAGEAAPAPVLAVGLGIPCLVDPATGVALDSNHLPLHGVAVRDVLTERLGLPVAVDNDGNAALLAEWRLGEARGARNAIMLTLGTGIGGGLLVDGRIVYGHRGAAAELGHIIVDADGPPCPGSCPNHGCLEALVSGHAIGAEGLRLARAAPNSALGRALDSGPRDHRRARHRAGPRRRSGGQRRDDVDGRAPGPRRRLAGQHLQPRGRGGRWRSDRGRRAAAGARARGRRRACAAHQPRRRAARVGSLRRRVGDARGGVHGARPGGGDGAMSGRLIVCPTPIGNLEDVTLRVLSALREADVIACEDTRTTKVLLDRYGVSAERVRYDAHAERRVAPKLVERMRSGAVVALVSDAGMPLVSDPGLVLVQACMAAGLEVEVLPGPSAALAALVASGMEAATWRFVGFLPRKKGLLAEVFTSPEVVVAFESPRRVGASLAVLAGVDPDRPVAVCRELTKVYEEVVRGSASELAARYADEAPRGEVVLVIGGAVADEPALAPALAALRRLVDEGGARPRPAAAVVAELTGTSANALYRRVDGLEGSAGSAVARADRHGFAQRLQQMTRDRLRPRSSAPSGRTFGRCRRARTPSSSPRSPSGARS